MTITLEPELAKALADAAERLSSTPEALVRDMLKVRFLPPPAKKHTAEEWKRLLKAVATPCGVAPTHEQLSSEGLYE